MLVGSEALVSRSNMQPGFLPRMETMQEVRKIAVLRANAIGDFIFTLPALHALRAAYPQAEIVLLGLQWHADFWRNRPGPIDRVVIIPAVRGLNAGLDQEEDADGVRRFFDEMMQENFDLAIQLHGGGRYSNPFIQHLGARVTAGAKTPDASPLDLWVPYIFYHMEVLRNLEIVSLVGAKPVHLEPRITITRHDLEEADRLVPPEVSPLVVMHPGAGDPRRRWPAEKFVSVGNSLVWAGARVAVVGTHREMESVEAVVDGMNGSAINLSNSISLGGLAGLFSRSSLFIGNDSGPLHLARAAGAATVGIYWCGNLITAGPLTTARHRVSLSWRLACPTCGLDCTHFDCGHRDSFVTDVTIKEVYSAALDLLFSDRQ